jgi:predicted outer membrane repeat protein
MKWLHRLFAPAVRPASPRRTRLTLDVLEDRFVPAVLAVTSLADDFTPGTLRAAVQQANSDAFADTDTTQFAPGLSGTITLGAPLELTPNLGVTILGSPDITLSGSGNSQVFQVDAGASVSLNGLTITNGTAVQGGAIYNAGLLTLNGDTLSANAATYGGGIYNQGYLTLDASTLSGNSALSGGGLFNGAAAANATVQDNCILVGNSASLAGGAIENFGYTLSIRGSSLINNTAAFGGAVFNEQGARMFVASANLSYNTATASGGAVFNIGGGSIGGSVLSSNSATSGGGAIANTGSLTISASNLTANTATLGGAIANVVSGSLDMSNDTVSGNTANQGGGIFNAGALLMVGDYVYSNHLSSGPSTPLGSGLYNQPGLGGVTQYNTWIAFNVNADGSYGGDTYGVVPYGY